MARLIDAEALLKEHCEGCTAYDDGLCSIADPVCGAAVLIAKAPTIDAVPVVRCKDCKHRRDDEDYVCGHYCVKRPHNGGYFCEDNDYCSYGERIDNG